MSRVALCTAWAPVALLWPLQAHAQRIPDLVIVLGLMPVAGVILAALLGALKKSWRLALGHLAAVALWIAWFVAAAQYSKSDWMNWAPIAALALHLAAMLGLIGLHFVRRPGNRPGGPRV